jgi:hypothetical protein
MRTTSATTPTATPPAIAAIDALGLTTFCIKLADVLFSAVNNNAVVVRNVVDAADMYVA